MPFNESTKSRIRKRADFRCCLCRSLGIQIHHIIPESENGSDDENNGAPLCPSCHDTFGGNPQKRRFVREARDYWYEVCERNLLSADADLSRILQTVRNSATKDDVARLESMMGNCLVLVSKLHPSADRRQVSLGEALAYIYSHSLGPASPEPKEVNATFELVFEGWAEDKDLDRRKNLFLDTFGKETARRLCAWVMRDTDFHPYEFFTVPDFQELLSLAFAAMKLLLAHDEIMHDQQGLRTLIDENQGDLVFLLPPHEPEN